MSSFDYSEVSIGPKKMGEMEAHSLADLTYAIEKSQGEGEASQCTQQKYNKAFLGPILLFWEDCLDLIMPENLK